MKNNTGIDFFPFSTDFFEDDKIELIESEFGIKGSYAAIRLLCKIYKFEGYFCRWGRDECLIFAKKMGDGFSPANVEEIVQGLIRRGFFDKAVYDSFHILTSRGMQKRFFEAAKRRQVVYVNPQYLLADIAEFPNVKFGGAAASVIPPEASAPASVPEPEKPQQLSVKPSDEDDELEIVAFFLFDRNFYKPQYQYQRLVNYNLTGGRNWASMNHQMRIAAASMWNQQTINGDPETNPRFGKCPAFRAVWKQIYQIAKDELKADKSVLKDMLDDGLEYRPKVNVENETIDALMCADSVTRLLVQNKDKFAPILKPLFDGRKMKFFQMAKKK